MRAGKKGSSRPWLEMSVQTLVASRANSLVNGVCRIKTKRRAHASCSEKPLPLSDMWVLVLQMTVWPDEGIGREDHLVLGLLELLQQFFRARGEDHVIAARHPRTRLKKSLYYNASG